MDKYFIERPVLAWVLALLAVLGGGVALFRLPVELYPEIAPPEIIVTAKYPGASATVIDASVTQPMEQQLTGLEGLTCIASASDASGQARITLTFEYGTDANVAMMRVQNKLQLALGALPEEVRDQGLQVMKTSRNFILIPCFYSEDGQLDSEAIADYVASNVVDIIGRLPGVGAITMYGSQYAMKIWLNPQNLEKFSFTPADIMAAVRAQNAQIAAGQLGGAPAMPGQETNITVEAPGRLNTVNEFENILLRGDENGAAVRLGDVARVELAAENPSEFVRLNGKAAAAFGIGLVPGANALKTTAAVKKELASLERFFPAGLKIAYSYDCSPFARAAIIEVCKTLAEAVLLVFMVMFLFMGNWRATLVPVTVVPAVLLGTFGVLALAGYSINTITLFALVLAIGLIVDDATVLVENADRLMAEEGLSPREAAMRSMRQIAKTLLGITIILLAVFSPLFFMGGSTGVIYRQLAVTLMLAMCFSLVLAVILGPVLCATFLKSSRRKPSKKIFSDIFNSVFAILLDKYLHGLEKVLAHPFRCLWAYAGALGLLAMLACHLPAGFLPQEDQARLFVTATLRPGASLERTAQVLGKLERHFLEEEADAIDSILTVAGRGFNVNGQNTGALFIRLKDWSERSSPSQQAGAVQDRARKCFARMPEARISVFSPPAVPELGNASGFDFMLVDRSGLGHGKLMAARDWFQDKAGRMPGLANVRPAGLDDVEQYRFNIDREKALAHGLAPEVVNEALTAFWGAVYINDFMDNGRSKKVYMQADIPFRMNAEDFGRYHIRSQTGHMVPFSVFMTGGYQWGAPRLERFNGRPAIEILGEATPGSSSGEAMNMIAELAGELPPGTDWSWTGLSLQEEMGSGQKVWLYLLAMLVVFLCLAALYGSWLLPVPVLMAIPTGALGVFIAAYLRHMNNDIYFQVGLLTIIAISARNAIFIVEFAKQLVDGGLDPRTAIIHAAGERFRPILITSLTFVLGVMPLAFSSGAMSGAQNVLGTVVIGGMVTASILVPCFTPVFYITVELLAKTKQHAGKCCQGVARQ